MKRVQCQNCDKYFNWEKGKPQICEDCCADKAESVQAKGEISREGVQPASRVEQSL